MLVHYEYEFLSNNFANLKLAPGSLTRIVFVKSRVEFL